VRTVRFLVQVRFLGVLDVLGGQRTEFVGQLLGAVLRVVVVFERLVAHASLSADSVGTVSTVTEDSDDVSRTRSWVSVSPDTSRSFSRSASSTSSASRTTVRILSETCRPASFRACWITRIMS